MSGYDYTFVSFVAEEDTCPICSSPMKEPVQTRCGHRFCRLCLEECVRRKPECPIDREDLGAQGIFPDRASERKILDYQVKCPNKSNGCQWIGELRNIEAHENNCLFVRVRCTNDHCDVVLLKSDLQRHLTQECPQRTISCQYCQQNYIWRLEQEHFNSCQRFPCTCLQRCGQDNIPRNELNSHLEKDCGLTEVSCSYAHVGCQAKVPRNALGRHLQLCLESHLNMAFKKLRSMENEFTIANARLEELESSTPGNYNIEELHSTVSDNVDRISKLEASLATSKLEIAESNKKIKLLENLNIRKQQEYDELIERNRRISEDLQNEIEAVKKKLLELSGPSESATGVQAGLSRTLKLPTILTPTAPPFPPPEARRELHPGRQIKSSRYIRPQHIKEDESTNRDKQSEENIPGVNPLISSLQQLSTDVHISNKFIWKFTQFDDAMQKAKYGSKMFYRSDPFLTGPYGYKMCVEFHPNGLNEGWNTHLSIFVCLLRGEYDDILPWPFNRKVIITLIEQQPNPYLKKNVQMSSLPKHNANFSLCYSTPSESRPRNTAFGFCKFVTQERLKSRRYLVNDTIFICVEVERLHSFI